MPAVDPASTLIFSLLPAWSNGVRVSSAWEVDRVKALSADTSRQGLTGKPYRVVSYDGIAHSEDIAAKVVKAIQGNTGQESFLPLVSDPSFPTSNVTAGDTTIYCPTSNRRFFVGYRALICEMGDLDPTNTHIVTITGKTSNSISFAAPDAMPFSADKNRLVVYPLLVAREISNQSMSVLTGSVASVQISGTEKVGASALPALVEPGTAPSGEPTYNGIPVFTIPHDWEKLENGSVRESKTTSVGIDSVTEIYGNEPFTQASRSYIFASREEAFRFLRFFDSRGGSLHSFWLPLDLGILKVVGRFSSSSWLISKSLTDSEISGLRFLAFWGLDGSCTVCKVNTVVDAGDSWNIVLDRSIPLSSAGDVDRVTTATLAIFNSDSAEEEWLTDECSRLSMKFLGVRANDAGDGEDQDDLDPPDDPTTGTDDEDPWEPYDCAGVATTVPMYFDSTQARNSWKEPIRAADLALPTEVFIKVRDGLVQDALHSHAPALSDELFSQLRKEHKLTYVGAASSTRSRNPYHIRIKGTAPSDTWEAAAAPGVTVQRKYWEKVINYSVGSTPHTLTLRKYAEWSTDSNYGAWGTLFVWVAFSTEVNPSYVDGTPWAAAANISFLKDDPVVWGPYGGQGFDKKYAHPQALFVGMGTTSMHAPFGGDWVPPDQRRLAYCYQTPSGVPWTTGGSKDDAKNNSVFGVLPSGYACMSLGGDSTSDYFEWVCLENPNGTGMTALKPTHAGWSTSLGNITPDDGCDVKVRVCNPGQTAQTINTCDGHPLAPFEGIGGTHVCFKNSDASNFLCVNISALPTVTATEACVTITDKWGVWDGSECPPVGSSCGYSLVSTYFTLELWDYYYAMGTDAAFRLIEWRTWKDNPSYTRQTWDQATGATTNWAQTKGTWTFGSGTFTNSSALGSGTLRAFAQYDVPGDSLDDGSIRCKSKNTTAVVGVAARMQSSSGQWSGYIGAIDRAGGKATIYKITTDTLFVLAQSTGLTLSGDIDISLNFNGSTIGFSWGSEGSLSVEDCTYQTGGECGIVVLSGVSNSQYQNIYVTDSNWRKLTISASIGALGFDVDVAPDACWAYANCQSSSPPGCPSQETCPCETITKITKGTYSFNHDFLPSQEANYPGGSNPYTDCADGKDCESGGGCTDCPAPFAALTLSMPSLCESDAGPSGNYFLTGISFWYNELCVSP